MIYNHIPVTIGCLPKVTAAPINFQYDQVQILQIGGIELPTSYRVDFCNPGDAATITMVGTADGVEIPNQLLATGRPVIAYVVLNGTDENAVETRYQITLPVNKRPPASDIQPTPAEQSTIDSLIESMNDAVDAAEDAQAAAELAQDGAETAETGAEAQALKAEGYAVGTQDGTPVSSDSPYYENNAEYMKDAAAQYALAADASEGEAAAWATGSYSGDPSGIPVPDDAPQHNNNAHYYKEQAAASAAAAEAALEQFTTPTASASTLPTGSSATASYNNGNFAFGIPKGDKGDPGTDGTDGTDGVSPEVTITSITGGHTVKITDADHPAGQSFNVMNGTDGTDGTDGVSPEVTITSITGGHTVKITDADHPTGQSFNVMDGEDGVSPEVTITSITGGHTVKITDADHPTGQSFNVMDGTNTDADDVTYDPTETYTAGSVGAGLNQLNSEINDLNANKAPIITDTASGAIASFPDGADGLPIKTLTAQINPVQDLHGYDNPWPAGGGANIWDEEWELGSYYLPTGVGSPSTTQIRSKLDHYIPVQPETTYYGVIGSTVSGANGYVLYYDANKTYLGYDGVASHYTFKNKAFTTPANCYYIRFYMNVEYGATYNHDIAINYPSTVTTYSPYSNLCPISGWTGANVYDTGVNIWDGVWESGYIDTTTGLNKGTSYTRSKNYVPVKPNTTYFSTKYFHCFFYTQDKSFIRFRNITSTEGMIEVPENCYFIRFCTTTSDSTVEGASINYPSTDHDYHAYQGHTLPITFPDSAGTVYGGELTVNEDGTGVLTVTHVMDDMGDLEWVYNPEYDYPYFTSKALDYRYRANGALSVIAEMFKGIPNVNAQTMRKNSGYNGCICYNSGLSTSYKLIVQDLAITSENDFTDAVRGTKVVSLITPSYQPTYNLTADQLMTLKGENNIWADTGDVSLEYRADTKLYLEKLTAPTEDDLVADHAIASGTFFMIGNTLYKATAAIANGAAITVGTNATQLSLADALNQLNS